LIDARAHGCLADAAMLLGTQVVTFAHRDAADYERQLRKLGAGVRPIVLTDGMFAHDGSVAPLDRYLAALPANGVLLVDDAHGAGVLGKAGQGTPSHFGLRDARIIQTITMSKAFGTFGGAILGPRAVAQTILAKSRSFTGATPMPLPIAAGALESIRVFQANPQLQSRLHANVRWVWERLRSRGVQLPDQPGPVVPVVPASLLQAKRQKRRLLAAGIFPPLIRYPGGPEGGYFRIVISSHHTRPQLAKLVAALSE